jgi:hypothetical protein
LVFEQVAVAVQDERHLDGETEAAIKEGLPIGWLERS